MFAGRTRLMTIFILVAALLLVGFLLAACGDDETDTETTEGAETTTSTDATGTTDETGATDTSESAPQPPDATADAGEGSGQSSYEERLPELEEAAEQNPEDLQTLQDLAIGYYQTEQYEKAEQTYLQMLDIEDSAEIHNNLGNVYRDWGEVDQAIEQYETAIELDESFAFAYGNLAMMQMTNGNMDEAIAAAERGVENTSGLEQEQLQNILDSLSAN